MRSARALRALLAVAVVAAASVSAMHLAQPAETRSVWELVGATPLSNRRTRIQRRHPLLRRVAGFQQLVPGACRLGTASTEPTARTILVLRSGTYIHALSYSLVWIDRRIETRGSSTATDRFTAGSSKRTPVPSSLDTRGLSASPAAASSARPTTDGRGRSSTSCPTTTALERRPTSRRPMPPAPSPAASSPRCGAGWATPTTTAGRGPSRRCGGHSGRARRSHSVRGAAGRTAGSSPACGTPRAACSRRHTGPRTG